MAHPTRFERMAFLRRATLYPAELRVPSAYASFWRVTRAFGGQRSMPINREDDRVVSVAAMTDFSANVIKIGILRWRSSRYSHRKRTLQLSSIAPCRIAMLTRTV